MRKYALIINKDTKEVQVGLGTDEEFYKSIGMKKRNVTQAPDGRWFVSGNLPKEESEETESKEQ
jgi:hypothetical protein